MPCGLDATEIQLPKHGVPHGIDRNWFYCCQPYKILVVPFLEKDDEFESDGTQLLNDQNLFLIQCDGFGFAKFSLQPNC
jgi:hypothetical protein